MPKVEYGENTAKYGPGVFIELSGVEVAKAIDLYLYSQDVIVQGPRTIFYDGKLLKDVCMVYVDPSGFVIHEGEKFYGSGEKE